MKTINYLIVRLEEDYQNEKSTEGGNKIIVNSSIENVKYINRVAEVVSAPDFTILQKGDKVVTHHNIFRKRNDVKGNQIPSNFHIKEDLYFVPLTEAFMYKREEEWQSIAPYCFVKPIKLEHRGEFQRTLDDVSHEGMVKNQGIMCYSNQDLLDKGVEKGDRVLFTNYSEYEFMIENELYYKMSTKDIIKVL